VLARTDLKATRDQLLAAVERESAPLELTAFAVRGEPITFAEAMRGEYQAFKVGDTWGPPWSTTWFHIRGRIPEAWDRKRVIAVLDIGFEGSTGFTCEALAWRDGKPPLAAHHLRGGRFLPRGCRQSESGRLRARQSPLDDRAARVP
jgi:hypothetical protein